MDLAAYNIITPCLVPTSKRLPGQNAHACCGTVVLRVVSNTFLLHCATKLLDLSGFNLRGVWSPRHHGVVISEVRDPCVVIEDRPLVVESPECNLSLAGQSQAHTMDKVIRCVRICKDVPIIGAGITRFLKCELDRVAYLL